MKREYLNAIELKARFIDYLLKKTENVVIGNEWIFGTRRHQVDLVYIIGRDITALEIKSDKDSLKRLTFQLDNYRLVFDYIYVLTGQKYYDQILKEVADDVGIFLLTTNGEIKKIRSARKQKKLSKFEMLYSINARYLSIKTKITLSKNSSDDIRVKLSKKGLKTVKMMLLDYLYEKLLPGFQLFMLERGEVTHSEDVSLFTQSKQRIIGNGQSK